MARHVGIGFETTWGTAVASTHFVEAQTENMRTERSFEEIQTIRTESTRDVVENNSIVRGDVEIIANYQDAAHLAYMLLGSVDTTGAGPYTHTSPATTGIATRPALTIEVQRDSTALTWRYAGCILTGLTLNATTDQSARWTASFVGKSEGTGTATTASFPAFDVMLAKHISAKFDGTTLDAQSATLTIAYPVDEPVTLGSAALAKQPQSNDVLAVTGEVTVLFEDLTQYNKFDGSTVVDFQLAVTDGTHEMTINCNKTRLTQTTPALSGRERLTATYAFTAYFDATATENIQVVTVNDEATVP